METNQDAEKYKGGGYQQINWSRENRILEKKEVKDNRFDSMSGGKRAVCIPSFYQAFGGLVFFLVKGSTPETFYFKVFFDYFT